MNTSGSLKYLKRKRLKKKLENLKENFTKENLEKIIEDFDYNEVF